MQTTCPECRTTFRVSQENLGARRGLVRCGSCHAVFNAYDTLLPELETPSPDEVAHAAPASAAYEEQPPLNTPLDALESAAGDGDDVEIAGPPAAAAIAPAESGPVESEPAADEPDTIESAPALATLAQTEAEPAAEKAVPDILLEPMWPVSDKPKRTWKFWLYLLLVAVLAAALLLQTLYFLRGELAAALPATRPALESLCRPLACTVPLARQLDKSAIAASSLEHDPENKSRVKLSLLLANRSGQAQAWPWIMLTLSDVRQAPVAQKVFRPSAYLPKDLDASAGLAAGSEREIRLDLDIGNLVASGYAVNLSYP
jgi:predicted Zn finger-like uncharacterized protein